MLEPSQIESLINDYTDATAQITLGESKAKVDVNLESESLTVAVTLGYPAKGAFDKIQSDLKALLQQQTDLTDITVTVSSKITKHKVQQGVQGIKNIKNIIAVASG